MANSEPTNYLQNVKSMGFVTNSSKSFSLIAAFMCCVDGDVDDKEISRVVKLGKKFLGSSFSKSEFEDEIRQMMSVVDFELPEAVEVFEKIIIKLIEQAKDSSDEDKQSTIAFLCEIAYADGVVDPKELSFINSCCDALAIKNPFSLSASGVRSNEKVSEIKAEADSHRKDFAKSIWMLAQLLTDAAVDGKIIPASRKEEGVRVIGSILSRDPDLTARLMDPQARNVAVLRVLDLTRSAMGIDDRSSTSASKSRRMIFLAAIAAVAIGWFVFGGGEVTETSKDWTNVVKTAAGDSYFIDLESIIKDGNTLTVMVLNDYGYPDPFNKSKSSVQKMWFHCKTAEMQLLTDAFYSDQMAKGRIVQASDFPMPKMNMPDDSTWKVVADLACK